MAVRRFMNIKLSAGWVYGGLIVGLAIWILHGFVEPLLAACVTAVASWPLYRRFAVRVPPRVGGNATAVLFTLLMVIFVLAPLVFALSALLTEAHALILELAMADEKGIPVPQWLEKLPLLGPWTASRWQHELAHPGALVAWTRRADTAALLATAQSLGQFMARHAFIVGFTILLLYFLYREGETLEAGFRRLLHHHIGERSDGYLDLATRAMRASVNSMLVVALFDGCASGAIYALAGVPKPGVWAAITGLLALVPFLGYVAVILLALQLAMTGAASLSVLSLGLGCAVLFCGDKIVRPAIGSEGMRLRFVWVLMGCLGGFEVLGLVGLVIGPVVLTLVRELWEQRIRALASTDGS
jgi:predicted PurR-regulated permease PerM